MMSLHSAQRISPEGFDPSTQLRFDAEQRRSIKGLVMTNWDSDTVLIRPPLENLRSCKSAEFGIPIPLQFF
jgi:hypothetical protein